MEMRWFDVRLANNYSKSIRIREMSVIEKIWTPDPYFVNSKYSYFHVVSFPNFRMRISPNGLVVYTLRWFSFSEISVHFFLFIST